MKVVISKTHLAADRTGRLVERTMKMAGYDVPYGKETTIYIDGEAALVIEPSVIVVARALPASGGVM